jgi:hypothetical protein
VNIRLGFFGHEEHHHLGFFGKKFRLVGLGLIFVSKSPRLKVKFELLEKVKEINLSIHQHLLLRNFKRLKSLKEEQGVPFPVSA